MALHHAESGELIDVRPLGAALRETISTTLIRSKELEVFRLVLPSGARVPDHKSPRSFELRGASTVHCLEGEVELAVNGSTQRMPAGSLIYLAPREERALTALKDSAVLVTMFLSRD